MTVGERLIEQGFKEGFRQGFREGKREARQQVLLACVRKLLNEAGTQAGQRIEPASDEMLERWFDRVFSAATLTELLAD